MTKIYIAKAGVFCLYTTSVIHMTFLVSHMNLPVCYIENEMQEVGQRHCLTQSKYYFTWYKASIQGEVSDV